VLALAIVAATVLVALATVTLGAALTARQRVIDASDAAALAAADVLLGAASGVPCEVAARVATASDAELSGCELDGYLATVTARSSFAGMPITSTSTAGPPS
jgi:secretion/DNA translocation related TadE-like protein